jgi:acetyl/propionyl-CoA carboxylase alpha subunit
VGKVVKLKLANEIRELEIEIVSRKEDEITVRIDGAETRAALTNTSVGSLLRLNGRNYRVQAVRERDSILVSVGPFFYRFNFPEAGSRRRSRGLTSHEIAAPMPGKVLKILVKEGEQVEAGTPLIVLEAMKMETTLAAESPAMIAKIRAVAGAMVDHGAVLIELNPAAAQNPSAPESVPPAS